MTQIQWTLCSERMPPDDDEVIIVKRPDGIYDDCKVRGIKYVIFFHGDIGYEWTPYTPKAWKELNK